MNPVDEGRMGKTGHQANECPEETQEEGKKKEELKKKMNGRECYTHVCAIFKDLDEEEKDKCEFSKRRTELMSVSPCLDIYSVTIAKISKNSIFVPINIGSSKKIIETLIDCGAGGLFINQNFAKKFKVKYLNELIKAFNVDGTKNKKGMIKSYVDLEF